MHTRSHGTDNLLSTSDLERAEQEKRAKRARDRDEQQQRTEQQLRAEKQLGHDTLVAENMADPPGAPEVPLGADQQHGGYPVHPPRPTRQIGAGDIPYTHVHRHGITPPPIPNINFEINASLISLVENSVFHDMKDEDPLKHLDKFDRICSLQNINGVSEDGVKLRLFPFSLGGRALTWETSLPFGSVTTWEQCKQSFLAKFFPPSRTAKLRNDISSFLQMNGESFSEAYERFKGYQMRCHHHGFSKESLLSTLYSGVLPKYRLLLDTASNGHFLGQDVDEGLLLVENIATSDCNYSEEYDRADRGSSAQEEKHKKEIKTLNDKLDKLLSGQQKQVHFIGEENFVQEEEINYVGNQGGYQNQRGQQVVYYKQGFSPKTFPPPGFALPQAQAGSSSGHDADMKSMLQQLIHGQASGAVELNKKLAEINSKVTCSYTDLNNKLETLNSKVQHLEAKSNNSSSSKGILPGKPIPNPKEYCGAIFSTTDCAAVNDENERAIEELSRLLYGPSVGHSKTEKTFRDGKRNDKKEEASKVAERENTTKVEPPPYKPELLFPRRVLTKAQRNVVSKFRTDLSEIGVHLPNMGNMQEAHLQMKLIRDILANKERVAALMEFSTPPAPPLLTPNSIHKLGNQGKFTLPCTLGDLKPDDALADFGASVNIISLAMVKRLGIKSLTSPTYSDMFGDATSKSPLGLVKDFPLKIGGCKVPIDLTVLDMVDDKEVPLILGTPFLTTVGASIDFHKKLVTLHNVNKEKREAPFERKDYLYVPLLYEPNFPFAGVISTNEASLEDPMKPPFEEIRMKEFRGWFYDEYDPGDPKLR